MDRSPVNLAQTLALIAGAIVLVLMRLHAFDLPLETDEANYAYIGGRLLAGDKLYVDVWDHQPPGVFVLFAGAIAVAGDAPEVFRWLAVLFSLASYALIFLIVSRSASRVLGCFAAGVFALTSADPGTAGEGCNREIFMNTLILAGWYAALRAPGREADAPTSSRWLLLSGIAFAAGSFLKTLVAIHWVGVAAWLAWRGLRVSAKPKAWRSAISALALFAAGPLVWWMATLLFFAATGRLALFVEAVFGFNMSYSKGDGSFFTRFLTFFTPGAKPYLQPFIFDSALPLWIAVLIAALLLTLQQFAKSKTPNHQNESSLSLAVVLLFASYFATCLPAQFWPHYYYLLLPTAIVFTLLALHQASTRVALKAARHGLTVRVPVILMAALLVTQYQHYISEPPFGITISRYNGRDFWGRAQGENIRGVTDPGDTIFVYGAEAGMYYYSDRRCASRYTMLTALRPGYAGHEERRRIMLEEIERNRPRLILVVLGEPSFPAWADFLPTRYDPVGWDFRDRAPHDPILMVLCDRDRPIESIDWNWDRKSVGGWSLGEAR